MKPSIGRIVHYVQEKPRAYASEGTKIMVHLPAIVVSVSADTCVNLMVLTDGSNSETDGTNFRCAKWVTSATLDDSDTPHSRTWHWPEKV